MTIKLVNLKNCPKRIDGGVYIGRGSKWGNPFVIGKDGDRKTVIAKYKQALWKNKQLLCEVAELEGKTLMCFCAPNDCHGHVLIAAAKWLREQHKPEPVPVEEHPWSLRYPDQVDHATQCALDLHDGC